MLGIFSKEKVTSVWILWLSLLSTYIDIKIGSLYLSQVGAVGVGLLPHLPAEGEVHPDVLPALQPGHRHLHPAGHQHLVRTRGAHADIIFYFTTNIDQGVFLAAKAAQ